MDEAQKMVVPGDIHYSALLLNQIAFLHFFKLFWVLPGQVVCLAIIFFQLKQFPGPLLPVQVQAGRPPWYTEPFGEPTRPSALVNPPAAKTLEDAQTSDPWQYVGSRSV